MNSSKLQDEVVRQVAWMSVVTSWHSQALTPLSSSLTLALLVTSGLGLVTSLASGLGLPRDTLCFLKSLEG